MSVNLIHLLLLIIIANGAPIILRALMGKRLDFAIDCGRRLPDNNPILGSSKTWRGDHIHIDRCCFTRLYSANGCADSHIRRAG